MEWKPKVVSTFSGCGGSCLGYEMAGFKVIWANEFVPIAQQIYKLNFPDSILDQRDIREIKASEILSAIKTKKGDIDVFDGSPPCQAFSTIGKRSKGWGIARKYEHGASQRNEDLFQEYIRLLRGLMPRAFIAENVSGLAKGVAKGYFIEILRELKVSGYRVEARLLDAQWLGVPQRRKRIIFMGLRNDLKVNPVFPKPFKKRIAVRDICPEIIRIGIAESYDDFKKRKRKPKFILANEPSGTITTAPHMGVGFIEMHNGEHKRITIEQLKRISSFPDDFKLVGTYSQQYQRLGNSVPPLMMKAIALQVKLLLLNDASKVSK